MRAAVLRALDEAHLRPPHLVLGALVAGLLLGPRAPLGALVVLAIAVILLSRRGGLALAVMAALVGGAGIADARLGALDHTTLGARLGHALHADVTVLEAPRPRPHGGRVAVVELDRERVLLRAGRWARWPSAVVHVGDVLAVEGALGPLPPSERWRERRAVHAALTADLVAATGARRGGLLGVVDATRRRAEAALQGGVDIPQAALWRGMVLGQDEALADGVRDAFGTAGLLHLVAASGQNIVLLAAVVVALGAALGIGLRARLTLVLAAIALYVPLAGAGPSIQRAGVMGAAGVVATLASRPAARWHALLLAAAVTLTANPRAAQEPGWQLSFAAVVAILGLAGRLAEGLRARRLPPMLAEACAMTAAATIGTAPLVALHFEQASLVALPANVLAAPAVAPIMWLGVVAATLGQLSPALAAPIGLLAAPPLAYLEWLAETAASLPGATVSVPPALVALACALAAGAVGTRSARHRRAAVAGLGVLAAVGVALAALHATGVGTPDSPGPPAVARVSFLDVGQGDAILIRDRTRAVLVDAGPPDGRIVERLRAEGIRRLDLLVVTHAEDDHVGGAAAVLRALPVAAVLDGRDGVRRPAGARMVVEATRRRVRLVAPRAGDVLRVGAVALRVLWPPARPGAPEAGVDPNQRAVVIEASVGGLRLLLTADAESDVLAGLDLRAVDVLKVSHHGSADEGLPGVLARVRPRLAVIEVGRGNRFGHPTAGTLAALRAARVTVLRTDRDGTVRLEPQGGTLLVQAHA